MRISDWSSDVCSSDLGERWQCSGKGARQRASGRTRLFRRAAGDRIMTGNLTDLTVAAIRDGFRKGEFTAREVADAFNANVAAAKALNAFIVETPDHARSEEHTSELPSLMRNSYDGFRLKIK